MIEVQNPVVRRRLCFYYANVLAAITVGTILYTCIHKDILLAFFERHFSLYRWLRSIVLVDFVPRNAFQRFVAYQAGDMLWAYAAQMSAFAAFDVRRKTVVWCMALCAISEMIQLLPFVYATFDVWDIAAEWLGAGLASLAVWLYESFRTRNR